MLRISLFAALLLVSACRLDSENAASAADEAPAVVSTATTSAAPNLCESRAEKTWVASNQQSFAVEAYTAGPACAQAEATLIVHGADHSELLRFTGQTEQIFDLREAADVEAMDKALAAWIDQTGSTLATAAALPDWAQGADQPGGEFPFYPDENITRDHYMAARAAGKPLFCFTQGLESMACYLLDNGELDRLGVQTFPG